jgi:tRNA (uracil-5-)-methyltransferase
MIRSTNLGGVASSDQKIGIKVPSANIGPPPMKKQKLNDDGAQSTEAASIADVINPWHAVPYGDQLDRKRREMDDFLKQIVSRTGKDNNYAPFPEWLERAKSKANPSRQACQLSEIVPSPLTEGYRNKIELSAGRDHAGRACFGFLVGAAADGHVAVLPPDEDCRIVSQKQRLFISDVLNPMLKEAGELHSLQVRIKLSICINWPSLTLPKQPWDKATHSGFFRLATLRVNVRDEALLMIQINPTSVSAEQLSIIISWMKDKVIQGTLSTELTVVSLFVQHHTGVSNAAPSDAPLHLVWGVPALEEELLGLKFQLSPTAFFQVNTRAAELLYSKVRELATAAVPSGTDVTVFDVCCGTGTIGLCVAAGIPNAKIVGVDIVKEAVEDAAANAIRNNISNTNFLAGKAEDVFPQVLRSTSHSATSSQNPHKYVAIVDPPRAGLHAKVIKALREFERIETLIYVSCNQKSLVNDASGLCRASSGGMPGREFEPISAIAVDLFPHTPHCELIVLFERRKLAKTAETQAAETPSL